ncbi:MAG: hypothetical protein AT716_00480 [Vulcanisaeta sp. MG_3]|jgi:hypothetical protein|nr:MAG: hypothetical protein AT716_00480 [Vulcanisaeta sp. MG_3]
MILAPWQLVYVKVMVHGVCFMLILFDFMLGIFIVRSIEKYIVSIVLLLIMEKAFREMRGLGGVC